MVMQQPNWLYCLCNELHEVDATTILGKKHRTLSILDREMMKATERHLFSTFRFGRERYRYIHIFKNVTDHDLTYMRLKYGFNRMYLVDEPAKSTLIANVGDSIYIEMQGNRHLEEEDVLELHDKSLAKLSHCEVTNLL
jgi:hypothetical protein